MKDHRSPLAKARDAFFYGDGKSLADATTLGAEARQSVYLRNRLERAFLAGAKAQEQLMREKPDATAQNSAKLKKHYTPITS